MDMNDLLFMECHVLIAAPGFSTQSLSLTSHDKHDQYLSFG